jgi:cell pole-organizing protein PopZ
MPGAKPLTFDTPIIAAENADHPASHEPSMDEILASIRQIISDQNDEADRAAVKAVEGVANPLPSKNKIDSIIGSVAADHWNAAEEKNAADDITPVLTPAEISQQAVDKEKMDARVKSVTNERPPKAARPAPVVLEDLVEPQAPPPQVPVVRSTAIPPQQLPPKEQPQNTNTIETGNLAARQRQIPATDSALERLIARRSAPRATTAAPIVQKPTVAKTPEPMQKTVDIKQPPKSVTAPLAAMSASPAIPAVTNAPAAPSVSPPAITPDEVAMNLLNEEIIKATSSLAAQTVVTKPPVAHPPLVSPGVNKSVNASFERLAVSMMEERKEEMDQMMVDIMRPMLQDWLEDNLPSLVERLVREEIERVSRGVH